MTTTINVQKRFYLLFIFSILSITSYAQFSLTGEYRPRFEDRHGYKSLFKDGKETALFISQRTRINLLYTDKMYSVGFSIQDIRVWGDSPLSSLNDNSSSFHEAWAELKFNKKTSLKIGRQELSYDDERLFSRSNWNQQGRSHDLALLKWNPDASFKVNIGLAFNQDKEQTDTRDYTITGNYKSMQFIWGHKDWEKNGLSFLLINVGNEQFITVAPNPAVGYTRYSQTVGGRYSYKDASFSLNTAVYLQTGKDATNRTLDANYAALDFTLPIDHQWEINPGAEHLSGTATKEISATKTNHSFTPLYGTAHKFNGSMDYFYSSNHLDNVGLNDIYVNLNYNKQKISASLTPHIFYSDAKVTNTAKPTESLNNYLGTELDLQINYKINDKVLFTGGYSQMLATRTLEVLKSGNKNNINNWAFLMLTFKPDFIK
ncbi:MAG: alginate export family protein [Bacteroidetes bacterium]|nr:alginate export family protein [Bacteroidota bacterium]